jgi:hypothetical protein
VSLNSSDISRIPGSLDAIFCSRVIAFFGQIPDAAARYTISFGAKDSLLNGAIQKPTGLPKTTVVVSGKYYPANLWAAVRDTRLMGDAAKYLAVEIKP